MAGKTTRWRIPLFLETRPFCDTGHFSLAMSSFNSMFSPGCWGPLLWKPLYTSILFQGPTLFNFKMSVSGSQNNSALILHHTDLWDLSLHSQKSLWGVSLYPWYPTITYMKNQEKLWNYSFFYLGWVKSQEGRIHSSTKQSQSYRLGRFSLPITQVSLGFSKTGEGYSA